MIRRVNELKAGVTETSQSGDLNKSPGHSFESDGFAPKSITSRKINTQLAPRHRDDPDREVSQGQAAAIMTFQQGLRQIASPESTKQASAPIKLYGNNLM
ncbi:hypothetical protein BaRGS_00018306 [Batillaria attramentaria]|uniref:Uncharacterized protein n=1 Tax=Batillaria attramentaria TaxID=370345 RepID=A0ABD0KTL8_9CAEN